MRIEGRFAHPAAGVAQVFAMLTDEAFQKRKCDATGALSSTVEIEGDADRPVVTSVRKMSTARLPLFVRRLAPNGIDIEETVAWHSTAADNSRSSDVTVSFVGQPVKMAATMEIRPRGGGTAGTLVGELKVGIPLLGGKIESAIGPVILKALAIEEAVGREWLGEN
jgi:Protein of unknown function (DUF2505)